VTGREWVTALSDLFVLDKGVPASVSALAFTCSAVIVCVCVYVGLLVLFVRFFISQCLRFLTTHRRVTRDEAVWWNVRVHSLKMRFFLRLQSDFFNGHSV
jgi:hypothetical protein